MSEIDKIRQKIVFQLNEQVAAKKNIMAALIKSDAYGHEAGAPAEEWVRLCLVENKWRVFYPNQFIEEFLNQFKKERTFLVTQLAKVWWSPLIVTNKQIVEFLAGKKIGRWQQEAADLVLFYGTDISVEPEKVILINVKSHEINRESRAPNIISAQRLLEFCHFLISQNSVKSSLDKLDYWFIGVYWQNDPRGARIQEIYLKDLFKLDTEQIPQINFDAAIQIQWHVKDMVEKEQTKLQFIERLANSFIAQWRNHSKKKSDKYEKLVNDINEKVKKCN
jgi:hypothetical protein